MIEEESILDNIETHKNFIIISINPKLYPLSVIYSAAYALLDKAHAIVDGDPTTEILVELRPKEEDQDLKELGYLFNDELINYAVYTIQADRNKELRELIMNNALAGNLSKNPESNSIPWQEKKDVHNDPEDIRGLKTDCGCEGDPEGIFKKRDC